LDIAYSSLKNVPFSEKSSLIPRVPSWLRAWTPLLDSLVVMTPKTSHY